MKRLILTILALAAMLVSAAAAASFDTELTGTAEWSGEFFGATYAIHGTFAGKIGRGTYAGTLQAGAQVTTPCGGPVCESVTGSITFSSKRGDFTAVVQAGSLLASQEIASTSFRTFTLGLRVVSGTRSYAHADGTLTLTYRSFWTHTFIGGVFVNEINDSGTLTGKPH